MEKLPPSTGWSWVKQGFGLFRKQPGGLATLFLGYMFFMLAAGILPLVGQILPVILVPVFSMAFMQACTDIEQGKRVLPTLLLTGFRKPVIGRLCALGLLYLLMAVFAIGASALVDDGVFWQLVTGQTDAKDAAASDANVGGAILMTITLYIPAAMGFCFAAPLICWQNMSLGKAIFFSFFAVLRALPAFITFAASWFAISVILSQVVILIFGRSNLTMQVMLPLSVIMTVIMHCSFYASYRQIFGLPQGVSLDKPAP